MIHHFEVKQNYSWDFLRRKILVPYYFSQGREPKSYVYDEIGLFSLYQRWKQKNFFSFNGDELAGQIILLKYWSNYCYINDLRVAENTEAKALVKLLIEKAIEWAKKKFIGMQVETRDINKRLQVLWTAGVLFGFGNWFIQV